MSLPISGFTAVPNPQMLAFMAAQSFVMMMQAGEGWQYGKRKQSAMTNEEFNLQTPLSIMQRQMSELKQAIPTIEQSMNAMTPMIRTIVTQYGDFIAEIIKTLPDVLKAAQGGQTLTGNISTVGQELADILKNLVPNVPTATADTGITTLPSTVTHENPPSDAELFYNQTEKQIQALYSGMTRNQLLKQQPSQNPAIKNSDKYSLHQSAWNTAYAVFTSQDTPANVPTATTLIKPELAHRITFRGKQGKVGLPETTFTFNLTFDGHKVQIDSWRSQLDILGKSYSPHYPPIAALLFNISKYSLEIKTFYGKWA